VERVASLREARGEVLVVSGLGAGPGPAAELHKALRVPVPEGAEALVIRSSRWQGKKALLVSGADDRGLMYALLDVADRVGWEAEAGAPLNEVRDAAESPAVPERALSKYTMHRSCFESYFHDEEYWAEYLDMLARNRFNTFALLFGYENAGYFAPPYPYFFDVDEFPDVKVVGITPEEQRRNLRSLNRIIEMTHARGLAFTLGIWDHIYRGGVQGPTRHAKEPTAGLVWGLTRENLVPYSNSALARFLREVPDLDAVQFRMHGESGLKRSEMATFWENIYRVVKASGRGIRFDARAKNFPDSLIDKALEMGIDIRICTKYWMEQMGMPFHPTHVHPRNQRDRRHGYADLLRYPRRYKMHWRLWNGGTTRILLWGDPDYVRRFAESTHLYDGEGFEVNEMLATKMQMSPHEMKPFELLTPAHRYCRWEFERYWHFFQLFGRLGYDPATPPEVWRREFERRFGAGAAPFVERGLHIASRILPRIVAYSYPYNHFPMTRGWVERQRQEDLPAYAKALPSDTQQFLSMRDAARCRIEGKDSVKIWPEESSRWFARTAASVLEQVKEARKRIGDAGNKEFVSTMVDLRILAGLALYHSHRTMAGVSFALFERAKDAGALDDAIHHEGRAIEAWEGIVEAAGDVYSDDIRMGGRRHGMAGHWRDELGKLRGGLAELERRRDRFRPEPAGEAPVIAHVPVRKAPPGKDLVIRATVGGKGAIASVRIACGNGRGGTSHVETKPAGAFVYLGVIPGASVAEGLSYSIEAVDGAGRRAQSPPVAVTVTRDDEPPALTHEPIATAPAGKPLVIAATVRDPSGVKWVRLRYRSVTQYEDYRSLDMLPAGGAGRYEATVGAEHVAPGWDFMYLFEVMDRAGNGKIYPDIEKETPYVVVRLRRGAGAR
ncbi:MAG: hypothetical protein ACYTFI_19370, partial [Planctomycetota bacterium]